MTLTDIKDAISQLKINQMVFYDNLANLMYRRTVNDTLNHEPQKHTYFHKRPFFYFLKGGTL